MKKYIFIFIAVVAVILAVILFKGRDKPVAEANPQEVVTVNIEPETSKESKNKNYDKTITVTLPMEFIEEEHRENLDNYAKAQGFFSIKKVDDEHVKIKMREYSYRLILTRIGMQTVSGIGGAMDSGDYPYFLDFPKYNEDFSYIVIAVDKEGYEKASNRKELLEYIAMFGLYYQSYSQESPGECEVVVCEKDTNILIESKTFTNDDIFG